MITQAPETKTPEGKTHEANVTTQFGPRAAAYVASAVHAAGEDLQQIAALAQAQRPPKALDLGCGGGHVAFAIAPHSSAVTAYDLSLDMLNAVSQEAAVRGLANIVTREGSVEKVPFADASFDFVVSRYSAHHWHNVGAGLAEARRVLKPGGVAVFADVVSPGGALLDTHLQAIELLRDPSHVRDYSGEEWIALLKAAGFVPAKPTMRRLHLEFSTWVARMATPEPQIRAIRDLQATMPRNVREYFQVQADGSFTIDSMTVVCG
jgi:ubiquinone/menaquinone biosynthesis C-methylase UbiE